MQCGGVGLLMEKLGAAMAEVEIERSGLVLQLADMAAHSDNALQASNSDHLQLSEQLALKTAQCHKLTEDMAQAVSNWNSPATMKTRGLRLGVHDPFAVGRIPLTVGRMTPYGWAYTYIRIHIWHIRMECICHVYGMYGIYVYPLRLGI